MQKFIHGTDRGYAALTALILVMVLSSFFFSLIPQINSAKQFAQKYRAKVIKAIEKSNTELINLYELH
jgi:competence protein ComGC